MEATTIESSTTQPPADILINFNVNGETFTLTENQLENFPCQDAYLNVLWRNLKTGQMNVETTTNGAIIIKALDTGGHSFKNFSLVARVYQDPTLSLFELLQVDSFLRVVEQVKSHYPSIRKQVNPELLVPQYDNVSAEHHYMIQQHPTYKWIERLGYEKLREEFKFYGIDDLPTLNPGSSHDNINPAGLKAAFERDFPKNIYNQPATLEEYEYYLDRGRSHPECHPNGEIPCFLESLRGMGGVISGSSVLKSVLQEQWDSSDLDVYVTENNLRHYVLRSQWKYDRHYVPSTRSSYLKDYETSSATPIIRNHLRDLLQEFPSGDPSYLLLRYRQKLANGISPKVIERELETSIRTEMMHALVKLLGGRNPELLSKTEVTANYHELSGISYVIRFNFCDKKVDLVVCKCTVPFVIDNFDFGFNKVYYDGYSINCLDWEAVSTKIATNDYCRDLNTYNEIERYVYNISRIRKYFRRGYLVLL